MNASGIVEAQDEPAGVRIVKPNESNGQTHINSNNLSVGGGKFSILLTFEMNWKYSTLAEF